MKSKVKQFYIQGIYHKLTVRLVSQSWLAKFLDDEDIEGSYTHADALIYIAKELSYPKRLHTLAHEIGHHIVDTFGFKFDSEDIEEKWCDLFGAFYLKSLEDRSRLVRNLKPRKRKRKVRQPTVP